jgi:hypothetical protein
MAIPPPTPTIDNTEAPAPADAAGNNALQGAASDDSGSEPDTPNSEDTQETAGSESPSINAPEPPEAERESSAPENDTQGVPPYPNELFDRAVESANSRPGKRLKNPLSFMASYTYQLSLYVITPDAYTAFIDGGRRNINVFNESIGSSTAAEKANRTGGAFLLAQSGGAGPDPRAPGVKYDYYIDNLSFTHFSSTKSTGAPTGNLEFKFQITEPYGFSFVNNLKNIQKEFDKFSEGSSWGTEEQKIVRVPLAKQFFILGIRFYGWDKDGRQVTGDENFNGSALDPDNDGNGALFETFYDLTVHKLKYKIDGKATVYNLEGQVLSTGYGSNTKRGTINSGFDISGATVREMLSGPNGLITKLNKEQQDLKNNNSIEHPVTYKILWRGKDAERIALASTTSKARENKANQPGVSVANTEEVNDTTGLRASPNSTQEKISVGNKPIIQELDNIFSRSSFVENALSFNYTDADEFDPETKSKNTKKTPKAPFRWYRITPAISNPRWDKELKDWAYDITYVIETYKMPVIDSPFAVATDKYYGPHKRYDYWYTGENTEILEYVQELNNQYLNEVPAGSPAAQQTENNEGNANQAAISTNTTQNIDLSTGRGGLETAAAGSIKNVLYDPGSYTNATIRILGDPDFLMQELGTGVETLGKAYDRYYDTESKNQFTIRPTGGQVFIEIDFKEPIDYSTNEQRDVFEDGTGITGVGGTLSINDSILFWDYPPGARDVIKGISYEVIKVENFFRNGQFTQRIEAVINDFGTGARAAGEGREGEEGSNGADSFTNEFGRTVDEVRRGEQLDNTGVKRDAPPGDGQAARVQSSTPPGPEATS